jgi:hypothetical protein
VYAAKKRERKRETEKARERRDFPLTLSLQAYISTPSLLLLSRVSFHERRFHRSPGKGAKARFNLFLLFFSFLLVPIHLESKSIGRGYTLGDFDELDLRWFHIKSIEA